MLALLKSLSASVAAFLKLAAICPALPVADSGSSIATRTVPEPITSPVTGSEARTEGPLPAPNPPNPPPPKPEDEQAARTLAAATAIALKTARRLSQAPGGRGFRRTDNLSPARLRGGNS